MSSLKKFMTEKEIFAQDTDMWLYHSKGNPALKRELMDYMLFFTEKVLGKFKNPYDRYSRGACEKAMSVETYTLSVLL